MKIYNIKVNGKTYKVELESIEEVASAAKAEAPKTATPAAAPVAAGAGDKQIVAPLQGAVTQIKVNVGDTVKKGQTVAIIEAMKLENEVSSPVDGVVTSVAVTKGASVATNDLLFVLK
ncbi:MAG: DUF2118 domain-containing protein [Bacilli bacterium]|nr:DUF2118 domain-containing protein [Bacilli bacterium]